VLWLPVFESALRAKSGATRSFALNAWRASWRLLACIRHLGCYRSRTVTDFDLRFRFMIFMRLAGPVRWAPSARTLPSRGLLL